MFILINERDAPPVTDQPTVAVKSWRVVQALNGDQHLLTILEGGGPVRMTSALCSFDPVRAELTTQSGRRYELLVSPETQPLQLALLHANALRAGLLDATDISDSIWRLVVKQ
jgi:hypothetical protein